MASPFHLRCIFQHYAGHGNPSSPSLPTPPSSPVSVDHSWRHRLVVRLFDCLKKKSTTTPTSWQSVAGGPTALSRMFDDIDRTCCRAPMRKTLTRPSTHSCRLGLILNTQWQIYISIALRGTTLANFHLYIGIAEIWKLG